MEKSSPLVLLYMSSSFPLPGLPSTFAQASEPWAYLNLPTLLVLPLVRGIAPVNVTTPRDFFLYIFFLPSHITLEA
jgi:hypothetical protein